MQDPANERRRIAHEIGDRLREVRRARGVTQAFVAGPRYTKAYISAIETGVARPSLAALHYIADRLRIPPERLVSGEGDAVAELAANPALIRRARIADGRIYAELDDGRELGVPLERWTGLAGATYGQLTAWRIADYGRALAWPELGEQISLDDFLGIRVLRREEVQRLEGGRAGQPGERGGKYQPLQEWLASQPDQPVALTFAQIEALLGTPLPASVRTYATPWHSKRHPLGRAIRAAGRRSRLDLHHERVVLIVSPSG